MQNGFVLRMVSHAKHEPVMDGAGAMRAAGAPYAPMATQLPADGQLTPENSVVRPLPTPGTATAAQCLPFQVNDAAAPLLFVPDAPTATQLFADVHETPSSRARLAPFGPVHLTTFQAEPFQTW